MRAVAIIAAAFALMLLATTGAGSPAPVACAEDDACWNCVTMGNRICGMKGAK